MIERSKQRFRFILANMWVRSGALLLYYLAILIGLLVIYGRGDFSTPHFIYQGF
jgi:hypothetical protein